MIDIGINYLSENNECYKLLKRYNVINTLKYPGRTCNYEELKKFLKYTHDNEFKIDLHGLPKMTPSFSCNNNLFIGDVDFKFLEEIFRINNKINRISTHIGLENNDRLEYYKENELEENWLNNYKSLQNNLEKILKRKIEIGLENIPGGFDFDIETITPEYVSENWRKADFGVFDIAHAKLSANVLNISYDEYLKRLSNIEKVRILHISGNIDSTEKYYSKPDKHVLISVLEIGDILKTITAFEKLDLIVSEYSYNTRFSSQKETIIEAVTINKIITTCNKDLSIKVMKYLEENLNDDISNAEKILYIIYKK